MVEVKKFSGILDKDTPESEVNFNFHIDANNVVFRGDGVSKRVQNMIGNSIRTNSLLPSTGTNQTIGGYYDAIRKRIFIFNWNSNNTQGIYIYNINTAIFEKLIEATSTGSPEDVLGFDPDVYIHSVNILYGGEGQDDSDILYFVDSYKRPTQINIDTYLTNTYPVVKRSYIDVIKAPPKEVPQVTYENDTTVTVNNLRNGLYQFRTRFVYDNREKSVYSSGSVVPLPYIVNNNPNDSNTSDNARIAVYVETGDETVRNIEIIGKRTTDNATQGWFLITSLDKQELGIADNSYYRFLFFNDGAYEIVDQEETTQLFDYVPDEANTQELLNGSIPIYGGIKEGYDQVVNLNMDCFVDRVADAYQYFDGLLFFGYQKSSTNIQIFLTGVGNNDGSGNPITLYNPALTFKVVAYDSSFSNKSFELPPGLGGNINTILTALSTYAIAQGFTVVSIGTNTLELSFAGGIIFGSAFTANIDDEYSASTPQFAFSELSRYSFGVQYFTDKGKTNGVTYSNNLSITTKSNWDTAGITINPDFGKLVPKITLNIRHTPPLWASYYHVVRTDTQTYLNKLYWVSASAYSDNENIGNLNNTRYAYIDISNISSYNSNLNLGGSNISYEFAKGDMIRFQGVYQNISNTNEIYYYLPNKDYQIIGLQIDPIVNGLKKTGTFIQIIYPVNDINANFKFNGDADFQNFSILIYTPKNTINTENLPFFEFGKKFKIGNAGTNTAYHIGLNTIQNNSGGISTPATITFSDGDFFCRKRTVPRNNMQLANDNAFALPTTNGLGITIPISIPNSPITVIGGIINSQILHDAYLSFTGFYSYPNASTNDYIFYNNSSATISIRVRFSGTLSAQTEKGIVELWSKVVPPTGNGTTTLVRNIVSEANSTTTFGIDYYQIVPPNNRYFLLAFNKADSFPGITYTDLKVDVILTSTTALIEKTWSDYYPIVTNSNSRPTVIDKDAKRSYLPTLVRWGLAYEQNTNINQTNRFKAINFDEIDRSKGDIQRFKARERILRVFQNRGVGQYGVYARYIQNNDGNGQLVTTNNVITANNIQYYQGDYGLGNMPTSLVSASNKDYFVDPVRGYQVRLSGDGMTPISEMYKGQFYIRNLLVQYNKPFTSPSGITSKILGYYDFFEEQYVCHLQAGQCGSTDPSGQPILLEIGNYTFAFNEKNNGYSSFFDFHPDLSLCAEEITYSFKDGELWVHDNYNGYCNFYGVQATPDITTVFNQNLIQKKTWISIAEVANSIWSCPVIYTNVNSYGTQRQQTNLIEADFAVLEGNQHASLLKDVNSIGGIANGDSMKGNWVAVKFQGLNPNNFVFLSEISMKYIISNLTNR